jgi:hypothetical protein
MVCDTQDNGSNAVKGDTKDDSSVTNRQQAGSNDAQGTNATPTVEKNWPNIGLPLISYCQTSKLTTNYTLDNKL